MSKDRDLEKNLPYRWFLAPAGLLVDFVVARLYVEAKWKAL